METVGFRNVGLEDNAVTAFTGFGRIDGLRLDNPTFPETSIAKESSQHLSGLIILIGTSDSSSLLPQDNS